MPLSVHMFPCLSDNYGFLIRDEASGATAAIDTPDAERYLQELEALGWGRLDLILNTHWHPDHAGGNERLKAETGAEIRGPEEVRRIAPLDAVLTGGDRVELGRTAFDVIDTPGHTLGHIAFHAPGETLAFVGDTMFALGCGRMFEGTPDQLWGSLQTLAALPEETVVWCAHEYTASNARFTVTVDDRPETAVHAAHIFTLRDLGQPTVPTTIGMERRFNPFVRARDADEFARLRAAKDVFKG